MDAVDVDDPLLAVDLGDLALASLVGTADNLDLVVLADGDRAGLLEWAWTAAQALTDGRWEGRRGGERAGKQGRSSIAARPHTCHQ